MHEPVVILLDPLRWMSTELIYDMAQIMECVACNGCDEVKKLCFIAFGVRRRPCADERGHPYYLSMVFKCRHKVSVCKTDRDQRRELWWCMNLLLSYLILFVECRQNWFMTDLIYDMAQMMECVASSISRWHVCKAEYYHLSCSTHSDGRRRDVFFSEAATNKLLPQASKIAAEGSES